jgi:hypothetical protein
MFKPPKMTARDFSCVLCGSKLGLERSGIAPGDNTGSCKMCGEPYCIRLEAREIEELLKAENNSSAYF